MSGKRESSLSAVSRIGFDPQAQLLTWPERHDASRRNRNLLARLGISAGPLVFVAQLKVAEAGQLDLLTGLQTASDLLEEEVHEFFGLPLVQPQLLEQRFGQLRLSQRHCSLTPIR